MILNIYKPKGWTSFDVVAKIRRQLSEKTQNKKVKVGHAGTLDPLSEGVLIVLTESDTKKQDEYMRQTKEYFAKIAFGAESETYDLEGKLKFTEKYLGLDVIKSKLDEIIKSYTGEIYQTVPPHSATKRKGKRLYEEARKSKIETKKLPVKQVTIYSIKIEEISAEKIPGYEKELPVLTCTITCSSGTYIRSLAHDIGEDLGTGGVLLELIRTKIGDFRVENSIKIDDLKF